MTRLKELRKSLGLTQAEFADKIAMAQQGVSMAENGNRPLTDRQIVTICAVFGVSEEWLRTGEGDMFPPLPEEDDDLIEALGTMTDEDIDPVRKKIAAAAVRLLLDLPEDAIPAMRAFIKSAHDALRIEKDED